MKVRQQMIDHTELIPRTDEERRRAVARLHRFGVFEAGIASAKDPKYTVLPQRERMAKQQSGHRPQ